MHRLAPKCSATPDRRRPRTDRRAAGMLLAGAWLVLAGCDPRRTDSGRETATPELRPEHRVEAGRALLEQYQCGSCHVIPGVRAARGSFGPTLEAFGVRGYIAGQIPNTAPLLQRWLQQPSALVPGTLMPAMGVSAADAQAMAAYLLALR
jgi:cytochrome c